MKTVNLDYFDVSITFSDNGTYSAFTISKEAAFLSEFLDGVASTFMALIEVLKIDIDDPLLQEIFNTVMDGAFNNMEEVDE